MEDIFHLCEVQDHITLKGLYIVRPHNYIKSGFSHQAGRWFSTNENAHARPILNEYKLESK